MAWVMSFGWYDKEILNHLSMKMYLSGTAVFLVLQKDECPSAHISMDSSSPDFVFIAVELEILQSSTTTTVITSIKITRTPITIASRFASDNPEGSVLAVVLLPVISSLFDELAVELVESFGSRCCLLVMGEEEEVVLVMGVEVEVPSVIDEEVEVLLVMGEEVDMFFPGKQKEIKT